MGDRSWVKLSCGVVGAEEGSRISLFGFLGKDRCLFRNIKSLKIRMGMKDLS